MKITGKTSLSNTIKLWLQIIFILGIFTGNPLTARNIRLLYDQKKISLEEANHILLFSHFVSPVFIMMVAVSFLGKERLGIILLLTHYISNIIIGILFRDKNLYNNINVNEEKKETFGACLINGIKNAIGSMELICGVLVIFLVLANIFTQVLGLDSYSKLLFKGLMEITIGMQELGIIGVKTIYKVVIASVFLAFGGLSIHMQVYSYLVGSKISYSYFLRGRIIQMLLALVISFILYNAI